jgi:hypothetical protein
MGGVGEVNTFVPSKRESSRLGQKSNFGNLKNFFENPSGQNFTLGLHFPHYAAF